MQHLSHCYQDSQVASAIASDPSTPLRSHILKDSEGVLAGCILLKIHFLNHLQDTIYLFRFITHLILECLERAKFIKAHH